MWRHDFFLGKFMRVKSLCHKSGIEFLPTIMMILSCEWVGYRLCAVGFTHCFRMSSNKQRETRVLLLWVHSIICWIPWASVSQEMIFYFTRGKANAWVIDCWHFQPKSKKALKTKFKCVHESTSNPFHSPKLHTTHMLVETHYFSSKPPKRARPLLTLS